MAKNGMQDQPQEIILKLKEANNILVTVSANPSVDQLSAAIGLTILLNKLKKHATAVFSGNVPSTIDFLKPDETLEKNTDSLRDFIIALDKSKADKLRYKVEENIVKIFITPYKTSITQNDLDFSQGDFNVDVVLALGVRAQQELDQAITAHGRILHDATVISVNTQPGSELGTINWTMPAASSLSELAVVIADNLAKDLVDGQIATALLTGIVAETERFSNEKTSPETMRLSAELMSAGANQQLVASELQQPGQGNTTGSAVTAESAEPKSDDGTLEINHPGSNSDEIPEAKTESTPEPAPEPESHADDTPSSGMPLLPPSEESSPHRIIEPPINQNSQLTANSVPEDAGDFGSLPDHEPDLPILKRDEPVSTAPAIKPADDAPNPIELPQLDLPQPLAPTSDQELPSLVPPAPANDTFLPLSSEPAGPAAPSMDSVINPLPPTDFSAPAPDPFAPQPPLPPTDGTLADIEQAIHSPHVNQPADPDESVDAARDAVMDAINSIPAGDQPLPPKADVGASGYLNVQDLPDTTLEPIPAPAPPALPLSPVVQPVPYIPEPTPGNTPADTPLTMPLPPTMPTSPSTPSPSSDSASGTPPPPPVPPPMTDLPPFVNPNK